MKKEATMKNDFFDAVKGISAPKETKDKKDKIQTLIPTEELQTTVDELVDWKKKLKEAKSETEGREADVIEYVKSFQDERGFFQEDDKVDDDFAFAGAHFPVEYVSVV